LQTTVSRAVLQGKDKGKIEFVTFNHVPCEWLSWEDAAPAPGSATAQCKVEQEHADATVICLTPVDTSC